MTQQDEAHFELHSANKDKLYQEYRCKNCEAHIIVKCNVILDWNTTRKRVG